MSATTVIILRLIHIVVGVFWVGGILFIALFLSPSVRAIGSAAGPVMQQLVDVRKLPIAMMASAILTILSGVGLFWNDSVGFKSDAWMHSGPGMTYSIGGTLAILAAIFGMVVNSPTAKKLGQLGAAIRTGGGAPSAEQAAEMQRLQKRLGVASSIVAGVLVIAVACMAVARYVP